MLCSLELWLEPKVFFVCFFYKYTYWNGFKVWPNQCIIWSDSTGTKQNNKTSFELNEYFVPFKPQWILRLKASEVLILEADGPQLLMLRLPDSNSQLPKGPRSLIPASLCSYSPYCLDSPSFLLLFYLIGKHLSSFKTQVNDHFIHLCVLSFTQPILLKIHHMPEPILVMGEPKGENTWFLFSKKLTI